MLRLSLARAIIYEEDKPNESRLDVEDGHHGEQEVKLLIPE